MEPAVNTDEEKTFVQFQIALISSSHPRTHGHHTKENGRSHVWLVSRDFVWDWWSAVKGGRWGNVWHVNGDSPIIKTS